MYRQGTCISSVFCMASKKFPCSDGIPPHHLNLVDKRVGNPHPIHRFAVFCSRGGIADDDGHITALGHVPYGARFVDEAHVGSKAAVEKHPDPSFCHQAMQHVTGCNHQIAIYRSEGFGDILVGPDVFFVVPHPFFGAEEVKVFLAPLLHPVRWRPVRRFQSRIRGSFSSSVAVSLH